MDLGFAFRGWQIEQGFLDVGRELIERHDLAHAWLGDMAATSEFDRI